LISRNPNRFGQFRVGFRPSLRISGVYEKYILALAKVFSQFVDSNSLRHFASPKLLKRQ
jgi:hypothetical protein